MTCIAGVVHKGRVWIGGDSAGVAGYSLTVRADAKVFRKGEMLIGFTSSLRLSAAARVCVDRSEWWRVGDDGRD